MPVVVGITIMSGHLTGSAARDRKPVSAVGFLALFALGTVLTIYSGVGRQSERAETKAAAVEQANAAIADKKAELAKARLRKEQAEVMADKERGTECGRKCKDWTLRATEVRANIEKLERELAALGSVKPVSPKAEKAAQIAALFGADPAKVQHGVELVEPCAYSSLLELTAIVAFGYGVSGGNRRKPREPAGNDNRTPDAEPTPPNGRGCRSKKDPQLVSFVAEFRKRHGRDPGTHEVRAAFSGTSKTTAQRYRRSA